MREFLFPEDTRQGYGYPELTDEIRGKIFGGNLARLLGVDATRRRVPAAPGGGGAVSGGGAGRAGRERVES